MKKLLILLFSTITFSTFCQSAVSTQELLDYNMDFGIRKITKKIPDIVVPGQLPARRFFGNLTTDTLIAAISNYVKSNLILTPEGKIIVKPTERIELFKNFYSEPETATNYTWKGKIIYTQKFSIHWVSDNVLLTSGVEYLYYSKHVEVSINSVTGQDERYVTATGPTIVFDPINHTIKAYRPALTNGNYAQYAHITIQYTKQ
jgi:hypothetical protein